MEDVTDRLGDLIGEPLLDLEPLREDVDYAGKLRQSDNAAVRYVRHVRLSVKRQHVVLAQGVKLDVTDHHHVFVRFLEQRVADDLADILLVSASEPGEREGDAVGCPEEARTLRILAQQLELSANELRQLVDSLRRVETLDLFEGLYPIKIRCTRHNCSPSPKVPDGRAARERSPAGESSRTRRLCSRRSVSVRA